MKRKVADFPEAGGRWCARHENAIDCDGDRKPVLIDGTYFVMCRRGRMEHRNHRAQMTKAFKAANMELTL